MGHMDSDGQFLSFSLLTSLMELGENKNTVLCWTAFYDCDYDRIPKTINL